MEQGLRLPTVTFIGPAREPEEVAPVEVVDVSNEVAERPVGRLTVTGEVPRPGPRETLRQKVAQNAEELASTVVDAALGTKPAARGRLALATIKEADPAVIAGVRIPTTAEDVERMGLRELRIMAEALGAMPS